MDANILDLVNFLADDATRKACLSGLFYGIFIVGSSCLMIGLRCSGHYIRHISSIRQERAQKKARKKAQKNLDQALAEGLQFTKHDTCLWDPEDESMVCRRCVETGHAQWMPVVKLDDRHLVCPYCKAITFISFYDRIGKYF